jgi:hypothetical protein
MKFLDDIFFALSLAFLLPGLPGAIFTTWLLHKYNKEDYFHQTMTGFIFFCMMWSIVFWSSITIYFAYTAICY